jgi:hypothetical protein
LIEFTKQSICHGMRRRESGWSARNCVDTRILGRLRLHGSRCRSCTDRIAIDWMLAICPVAVRNPELDLIHTAVRSSRTLERAKSNPYRGSLSSCGSLATDRI